MYPLLNIKQLLYVEIFDNIMYHIIEQKKKEGTKNGKNKNKFIKKNY